MTSVTSIAAQSATSAAASAAVTDRSRAADVAATGTASFDAALKDAGTADLPRGDFQHQSSRSGRLKPEQAFESFVLRSFIEEMLPKDNKAVFGGGTAGNIWRSMLAERIADEMAAGGGIGIAKTISRDAAKTD